jgi:hypothetical protein
MHALLRPAGDRMYDTRAGRSRAVVGPAQAWFCRRKSHARLPRSCQGSACRLTVVRKTKIRAEVAHEAAHFASSSVFMYCPITRRI